MKKFAILLLSLPLCVGFIHAAEKDDEVVIKRNAAEQAAALHQDHGGADRGALLAARAREKIMAGLPGQRTTHSDAQWFGSASLGLFLHWNISSAHGHIDLSWPMIKNMGGGTKLKPADYWKLADEFKAEHYNPNLWLAAAKDAGFDYAVLTTKHHDGFTLWPTEASEIGVRTVVARSRSCAGICRRLPHEWSQGRVLFLRAGLVQAQGVYVVQLSQRERWQFVVAVDSWTA